MTSAFEFRNDRPAERGLRFLTVTLLATVALLVASFDAGAQTPDSTAGGMTDQDYLAYSDGLQLAMEESWEEEAGLYRAGDGSGPMVNANMLLAHSVAALEGHQGPSRNDARARRIAARLVASPPFVEQPSPGPPGSQSQGHAPGWVNTVHNVGGSQHLVFDADVVDGLRFAWRARTALDLPQETVDLIVDRISRTTHGAFWRYPAMRLNQVNWYGLMYSATAEVTGDPTLLREDFHRQLLRFTQAPPPTPEQAGNFGPGMRFHYLPHRPTGGRLNVDSAEYANIVFSVGRFYEQARAAGMPALPIRERRLLRQWGIRMLAGYWTHAGYLNWDTGLGFNRWHQTKKIGLAQQALIALASTESLQTPASQGTWAKWMFDRGLLTFGEWGRRAGGIPPPVSFGVVREPLGPSSARLGVARMQANAGRAIAAGLGTAPSSQPPALYAFDPDIGRLAVTTPSYNTAVVAVNQGGFPYGGVELARLFDSRQDVAANIGGRPPAAFGLTLRSARGRALASTQVGRRRHDPGITPLELLRAPRGAGQTARAPIGMAFGGPFRDLVARGEVRGREHQLETLHRFTPGYVETRWKASARLRPSVRRRPSERSGIRPLVRPRRPAPVLPRVGAEVAFPSTGPGAHVSAILTDGSQVAVDGRPLSLAGVSYFSVRSGRSGYVIVPLERPAGATARVILVGAQWSAPEPGPSLVVTLAPARRFESVSLGARLVPVPDVGSVDATARQLGAP